MKARITTLNFWLSRSLKNQDIDYRITSRTSKNGKNIKDGKSNQIIVS